MIEDIFSILSKNDECYLRMAYQVILGREADPDGLKFWEKLAEKLNFDRIHLDLMALPL
ncbi:DUF4214 domain-containing protein [Planktothrix serta]|uniref:DUF4214 domain-containing protein n=1 Tax=Planktothrix serta TaxID=1678310 RepID=UPI0009F868A3|nr:DUF4214 domain-containing protein [Planktothrix serta]